MIELLNIQATNKDGIVRNYKEIRMIKEYGKMTIRTALETEGRDGKMYNVDSVYSYDSAIIVKSDGRIGFNTEHLTKTRYIKHYNQALELLYKDNESVYKKVLDVYNAVKRYCHITKHDVEYESELLSYIDGLGLKSYGDGGNVWVRMIVA